MKSLFPILNITKSPQKYVFGTRLTILKYKCIIFIDMQLYFIPNLVKRPKPAP